MDNLQDVASIKDTDAVENIRMIQTLGLELNLWWAFGGPEKGRLMKLKWAKW